MSRVRLLRVFALLFAATLAVAAAAPSTVDHKFMSASLQRSMPYRVILPDSYGSGTTRYPVLYLLHGYGGAFSNWTERTKIVEHAAGKQLIIVMPDGANSWYVDRANQASDAWESYLTKDLIAEVDTTFRTKNARESRMIAGLSMGGYGALKAAFKHPELYALAASFSGAFDITRPNDTFRGESKPDVMQVFGPIGSDTRKANDVYTLAAASTPSSLPYLWIACGTSDPWLEPNREIARALKSRSAAYEFHERPGGHDWMFWDWAITSLLADPHVPVR